ncbi:hypothetical protein PFLUV_G00238080 [Perca fluviatilis]|uniref:ARID domain-containing protein n=1 Tax=Perca fluviatilis TaxID=8168 RepID=A0A6A5DRG9_PERFL|nr:AT-rich interactive domain-containing protein 4A-like [Perca fluviatilis]KAF1375291.1 hypothetical protein PFLUV_G00238080 [Perca fluviatilis]
MYDSDRASNEDSGNSSEDSDSGDTPEKKPSPWQGRSEAPPCQEEEEEEEVKEVKEEEEEEKEEKEEEKEEEEEEEEEKEEEEEVKEEEEEPSEVADVPTAGNDDGANDGVPVSESPVAATPPRPSMPLEKPDKPLSQSEEEEAEQGAEPAVEAALLLVHLDEETKTSTAPERVAKKACVPEATNETSPGQEALAAVAVATPCRTPLPPPHAKKTSPEKRLSSPPRPAAEDKDSQSTPLSTPMSTPMSTPLSSPRVKGRSPSRRAILQGTGSETPPRIPLCSAAGVASPPRGVLKRQDEPMVVLHCLPTQRLPPPEPAAPPAAPASSDTDSASEEEEEAAPAPEQRSGAALKRKAAEQRTPDKKLRPDRKQEETLASPVRERRSEGGAKAEDRPRLAEETPREASEERLTGAAPKETEMHAGSDAGTPPPALADRVSAPAAAAAALAELAEPTAAAPEPSPAEDLEPELGPEALVCHEVDLDEPDEKEKLCTAPEQLLLMMRESQPPPPPLLPPILNVSPLPPPFLPVPSGEEEDRGPARAEQEGDSSPGFDGSASSSSTSLLSLQDAKDRGQKRVTECNLSPAAKKQKRSQKRLSTPGKVEKNGAGHSSDSEDQSRLSLSQKSQKSRCLSSPSSHSKDKHTFSPQRAYKWTFQLDELDSMSSSERISFLQDKLQEIRKYYMTLKSEVASIDRRRKRLKKKEREVSNTTASSGSSGSSDTAMSPSSASPAQNTVAVECR